MKTKKIPPQ